MGFSTFIFLHQDSSSGKAEVSTSNWKRFDMSGCPITGSERMIKIRASRDWWPSGVQWNGVSLFSRVVNGHAMLG